MATKQHQKKVVRWASDASEKSWMVRVSALHKQAQKRTDSYSTIFSTSLDLPFEEGWGWVGWDKTNTFLSPVFISALMCRKMKNVNVCFAFTASKRDIFIINEALQAIKFGSDIITAICPLSPSSFLWRASAVAKSTALACCHCLTWLWQTIQFQNSSKKHLFKNEYINK